MTRTDVKVGDKVRVVNAWHSGGKYKNGDVLTVERVVGSAIYAKEVSRLLVSTECELYEPIKVGDTVTLIDNFYEHEKFKAEPRIRRKSIASLDGDVFNITHINFSNLASTTSGIVWTIPLDLLRKVDDTVDKTLSDEIEQLVMSFAELIKPVVEMARDIIENLVEVCGVDLVEISERINQGMSFQEAIESTTLHRHTPEQVAEAQRIIGEIVAGFNLGQRYYIRDESDMELIIRYTAGEADGGHTITAHCSPHDEFNRTIGLLVALCKATGRKLPDWL